MKRQLTGWEKVFADDVTNKGLISKIYKQLIYLNNKKTTHQSKNGEKTQIDISKEETQWPISAQKRWSTLLIIRAMH